MTLLPYRIVPPAGGEPRERAPLITFLHGSGERGTDPALLSVWGPLRFQAEGGALPAFVAAPQCPLDLSWGDLLPELVAWLDDLLRRYPIDPDRVLLTGFSMGGFGAWQWALHDPDRFAALAPVAGSGFRFRDYEIAADLGILRDLPIWFVHSVQDEVVPVSGADEFHQALLRFGANFGYTRYPHAGHTRTAELAYGDTSRYDWLLSQKRQETQ